METTSVQAVAMPRIEVAAKDGVLLGGRHRDLHVGGDIGVAVGNAPHAARGPKLSGDHPDRDAAAAAFARRPVGDRLAAAEAALGEDIVEFSRALADEMGEHLTLLPAGEVRAWRRRSEVELRRIARVLGHVALGPIRLRPRSPGRY